jgi:hypothetical protein
MEKYEFPNSSAIHDIKFKEFSVLITYTSNIDKEYEFNCQNVGKFEQLVQKTQENDESIGKLVNSWIKEDKLVAIASTNDKEVEESTAE